MRVELAKATADGARREELELPAGATVGDALAASRLVEAANAETDGVEQVAAIHGVVVTPDRTLAEGERIDLLQPLLASPMQTRRRRADKGGH